MPIRAKYGAPFPHPLVVSDGLRVSGGTQVAYERGLVEGRRQILKWMREAIDTLIPMIQPSAMGKVLIEGLRRQVDKYLASGENPLEAGEEPLDGRRTR